MPLAIVPIQITEDQVRIERERRIDAGFAYGAHTYQSDRDSRENIIGAHTLALSAIADGGGLVGDYRWHGGSTDFVWLAKDNAIVQMDAETVKAFGAVAAEHKRAHIMAARAIKDTVGGIPTDYDTNDNRWDLSNYDATGTYTGP